MLTTSLRFAARLMVMLSLLSATVWAASGANSNSVRRAFGKDHPFTVDELPAGKLQSRLQALTPAAQNKAKNWLHTITFSDGDAAEHLRVDNEGGIFIVCPDDQGNYEGQKAVSKSPVTQGKAVETSSATPAPSQASNPVTANAPVPISSPPAYHSRPGAPYVIYIDFNGGVVSGKAWSETDGTNTWTSWDCQAWGTDTNNTTFSDSEQAEIRRAWERLSEDYAPYNVDVTTDVAFDPDNYTGDKNKVGWLMCTPTTDKNGAHCPHYGYGGVAYVGVYGDNNYFSTYQPAWVAPYTAANLIEAASHEMGHNMGLSHDGTSASGYYGGHSATASAPSWGPIMGTGYGQNVTQWSKGEYYDANQFQDDLTIISARVPYMADDYGDAFATATALTAPSGAISQTGLVGKPTDVDVFKFTTGAGTISLTANPYKCDTSTWGGNLDIALVLYDSAFTLIASNNPAANVTASISTNVAAGSYYLMLRPVGTGNPTNNPPDGYTVYGSLGRYTVTGNIIPTSNLTGAGTLLVAESCQPTNGVIDPDEMVTVQFALQNIGTANTSNLVVTLLATNGIIPIVGSQTYGVVTNGGAAVARSFTFAANGNCGDTIQAILQLQDGTNNYGYATNSFTLGSVTSQVATYENAATITIPASGTSGAASPYPSTINVAGFSTDVTKVTVTLTNLTHGRSADLDILLVGPGGQMCLLMSDAGNGGVTSATLTFDMSGAALPSASAITSGAYAPTDYTTGDTFNSPAPTNGSYGTDLGVFNGINPNGTWSLYIMDDANAQSGSLAVGWQIQFSSVATNCCSGGPSYKAALANFVPSAGTLAPAFAFNVYSYTSSVPYKTNSLTLTPTAVDTNATVTINGNPVASGSPSSAISLNVGTNVINTVVVAQDLSATNTYTLIVTRAAPTSNAFLTNLVSSAGIISPLFASNTFSYITTVPYSTTNLTVTPTAADPFATITVNGSPVVSGSPSGAISLNVGTNLINTVVVSDDFSQTNTYNLTVVRLTNGLTLWWDGGIANIVNNGDGASAGGSGTWNTGLINWDAGDGIPHTRWDNGGNYSANFAGTGGVVALGNPVAVNALIFDAFSGTYTVGTAGTTLTNSGGITVNTGAGVVNVISPTALGAGQSWINNSTNLLTVGTGGVTNNGYGLTVDGSGNTTISGVISGTGGLINDGTGTTILSSTNTYTGATTVNAGTLNLTGNRTAAAGQITVGNGAGNTGTLNLQNGNFSLGANNFYVGSSATGVVNQTSGAISFTGSSAQLLVGNGNGNGIYNFSGGAITSAASTTRGVMLGVNDGAAGTFNLSGSGSLNLGNAVLMVGRSDTVASQTTNTYDQTGGAATVKTLTIGGASATGSSNVIATFSVAGGTFVATNFTLLAAGKTNLSTVTIGGTGDVTLPGFPTTALGSGSSAKVYFNGGVVRSLYATNNFMSGLTAAYIKAGGAKFDTGNGSITIAQNLLTDLVSLGGGLTKAGTNTLRLTGANTYTGNTTNNAGTLQADNNAALGTGVLVMNGGALSNNVNGVTLANPVNLAANATVGVPAGTNFTLGGVITNTFALTKVGSGTLTLTNINTYTGPTTNSAGTLTIGAAGQLGAGSYAGNITNSGTFIYASSASQTLGGAISGAGALTKNTSTTSILTLSGANTYIGATTVSAGTLLVNGNNSGATNVVTVSGGAIFGGLGVVGGTVTNLAGSTLAPGDANGNAGTLTLTNGLGLNGAYLAFALTNASAGAYDQVAINNGNFVVNGVNLIQLIAATNQIPDGTYVFITNVVARTPAANQFVFHQTGTTNWTIGGSTLTLINGANSVVLTVSGGPVAPVSTTLNWQGNVSGVWNLTTLNWQSNGVAQLYANGNDVFFNDSASTFTVAGTNLSPGIVTFNNSVSNYIIAASTNTIGGTASVVKNGAGAVVFSGTNIFSGGTVVNAGAVVAGGLNNALGTGFVTLNGGSLSNSLTANLANVINLAANATVASASGTTLTLNGALTNAGSLTKNGTGTLTLVASNTYSGGTVLNAGTLATTNDFNFGSGGGIMVNSNATWSAGPVAVTYNRSLTVNEGAGLALASGNSLKTITGVLGGNGSISNTSSTTFEFTNAGNTFTGPVYNGYETRFASLGDSANPVNLIGSNSKFTWLGGAKMFASRPFTLNATGTGNIENNGSGAVTIQQNLAITGTAGGRTLSLGGSNTGTNTFAGNITDGSGSVVTLTKIGTGVWNITGNMSHTGGLTVSGNASTLNLSGTNTYSGTTTVGPGNPNSVLVIQGKQALSTNTTVNLVANSSPAGTLKLLDDTAGTITLPNTLSQDSANATINFTVFVGNNTTNNGGTSTGTTTGSTISLNKISATSLSNNKTIYGFKAEGANNYILGVKDMEFPAFLAATFTSATSWKWQLTANSAPIAISGTVQQLAGSTSATLTSQTLELTGTNTGCSISGNINDSLDGTPRPLTVTKLSSSVWTLSGTNTFSGGLTLNGASVGSQLNLNSATALGTGTFTISGGNNAKFDNTSGADHTLTANNLQTWNNDFVFVGSTNLNLGTGAVTMGGTRGITVTANTLTVGGGVGGVAGAGLTKSGNGTLVLNGTNTYTGATTVSFGTLLVNGDASAATNTVKVGVFGTFGGTGIVGGVTIFTNNSGKLLLTLTPTAATAYSNSTYLTFTNAVFLTNVTVAVNMPTNLGNGVYVLATNFVTPVTSGSLNFVTNSGSLAAGGSGVVSRSGNNLILTVSGVFEGIATTNTVTTSASPSAYSALLTFTSTVQTNLPPGTATAAESNVVFSVNGTPVATNPLVGGVATYTVSNLVVGSHTIQAAYLGDSNYLPSTNTVSQEITKLTPIQQTAPVASAITYGQTLASSTVTGGVFTNLWGVGNVVAMSSTNFATPDIAPNVGTTNVLVYFVPADTANYLNVTTTVTVTVLPASNYLALTASPGTTVGYKEGVSYTATVQTNGATATDATGPVIFYYSTYGTNVAVPFSTNALILGVTNSLSITNLPRGTNLITAEYPGDVNYLGWTNSLIQTVTNHPAVAGNYTNIYVAGTTEWITLTNLTAQNIVHDQDGDSITLVTAGAGATDGGTTVNFDTNLFGGLITFNNSNNQNDQFSYTVTDGYDNSTGTIYLVATNAFQGSPTIVSSSGTNLITFYGLPGYSYSVYRSGTVNGTYTNIATISSTNGVMIYTDSLPLMPNSFYKLSYP